MYWTVVKANLRERRLVGEFNDWYNTVHMPAFVRMDDFTRGWRIRRIEHPEQRGTPGQEFLAIYEVESIEAFVAALRKTEAESGHGWERWERHLTDWQRSYHRVIAAWHDAPHVADATGRYWAAVKVDFVPQAASARTAPPSAGRWPWTKTARRPLSQRPIPPPAAPTAGERSTPAAASTRPPAIRTSTRSASPRSPPPPSMSSWIPRRTYSSTREATRSSRSARRMAPPRFCQI